MRKPLSLFRRKNKSFFFSYYWRRTAFIALLCSCLLTAASAQVKITKQWDKTFGGNQRETLSQMIPTTDGGYLLGGSSSSGVDGNKSQPNRGKADYWVVKVNKDGTKAWDKTFGGNDVDSLSILTTTPDGGYLLGGTSSSGINGDKTQVWGEEDFWLVKIDANGNKVWDKAYGGRDMDRLQSIVATPDDGYLLGGRSYSGPYGGRTVELIGESDLWFVKVNNNGNKIWDKNLSFASDMIENGHMERADIKSILKTSDGSYLLGIDAGSFGSVGYNHEDATSYFTVVKLDENGNKVWSKVLRNEAQGNGGRIDKLQAMVPNAYDTYFILAGYTYEYFYTNDPENEVDFTPADYYVIEISSNGFVYNYKTFGGSDNDYLTALTRTTDGGYLLGGTSYSGASGDKSEAKQGLADYWVVNTDESFTKKWDKTLGSTGNESLSSLIATRDKDYLLGGTSFSGIGGDKSEDQNGLSDYWLVKINDQTKNLYCIPTMTYGCDNGHGISEFKFASLFDEYGGCGTYDDPESSYSNHYPYANVQDGYYTTTVKQGETHTISMKSGSSIPLNFGVWIDYNDDKDFDDAGEFVYSTPAAGLEFSGEITIPSNVSSGLRRLRVRSKADGVFTAMESCTPGTYGETDDYTIAVGYCAPYTWQGCDVDGSYINDFSLNTLVNNNSGCNGNEGGYVDYAPAGNLTTTVAIGQTYNISMQSGPQPQAFGVWIDFNNDKDFDDQGEFVYASSVSAGKLTGTITIPANAVTGQLRMRVRTNIYEVDYWDVCSLYDPDWPFEEYADSFFRGETEDYTITVTDQEYQDLRYGGSGIDRFTVVIQTSDGGYLSGGYSNSEVSGDKSQNSRGGADYWIVKTDKDGKQQWDKRYGGSNHDYLNRIIQTQDGGYLLAGSSTSGKSGDKSEARRGDQDYWIVKITNTGEKEWDKTYGGAGFDDLRKVNQLFNGDYLLAGTSNSPVSGEKSQSSQGGSDFWVIRVSSTGTKLWDKRYGGAADENLESFTKTKDGGLLLAGSSASGKSGDKTQTNKGGKDYWLVKIDQQGKQLWDKSYGGSKDDELYSIGITPTGEYFVAGHSSSGRSGDKSQVSQGASDYWLLKLDKTGAKLWDRSFGGSGEETLRSVIQSSDGGYLLAGSSDSPAGWYKTQDSQGGKDYWLVKTNAKGYQAYDQRFGGSGDEELRYIQRTQDGGLLLGGRSNSGVSGDRTQPSQGATDYWLVKIGQVNKASSPIARLEMRPEPTTEISLNAYPNPIVGQQVTITFTLPQTQQVSLKVYDSQSREVATLFGAVAQQGQQYKTIWTAKQQPAGMYILRLQTAHKVSTQKLILIK